jgi:hypothetical protein
VLNKVNNDDEDDFANFDEEDVPDPTDEQRALVALFEMACHDRAMQQFMVAERQAHQEVRGMWQRAHQVAGEDMDLMARVTMATLHPLKQQEAREAEAFHEAAAARAKADAIADAAAEDACAQAMQA